MYHLLYLRDFKYIFFKSGDLKSYGEMFEFIFFFTNIN